MRLVIAQASLRRVIASLLNSAAETAASQVQLKQLHHEMQLLQAAPIFSCKAEYQLQHQQLNFSCT
jgi:hypothetical protein